MRSGAAGMHHTFRDALVVEVGDLLAEVVVLEQYRAAPACLQRVVRILEPEPLRGGEVGAGLGPRMDRGAARRSGGRDRLGAPLVRLGRQRFARFRRLGNSGWLARRRAGNADVAVSWHGSFPFDEQFLATGGRSARN
ncbi:hypothetical protein D9M72_540020 [compost metagenome]